MERWLEFKPLIKNPYCQTILGTMINFERELESKTHYIRLRDNDLLAVEVSTPENWRDDSWTFYLVHGLCGSHNSHYMKRVARRLFKLGYQTIRINLRGCGSGRGLAKGIYHSGSSHDVREAIETLNKLYPHSRKGLIGFSLGGNIVLKFAGELGKNIEGLIDNVIAVAAPVDVLSSARLFMQPKNQIYARYFLKLLINDVKFIHSCFNELPPVEFPLDLSLSGFDEMYVAPRASFSSALEYYVHCSSKRVVPQIAVPTKILLAKDDPIISANSLNDVSLPSHIEVYKTQYGGHLGFMGQNVFKEFRWMDHQVVKWIEEWTPQEMKKKVERGSATHYSQLGEIPVKGKDAIDKI